MRLGMVGRCTPGRRKLRAPVAPPACRGCPRMTRIRYRGMLWAPDRPGRTAWSRRTCDSRWIRAGAIGRWAQWWRCWSKTRGHVGYRPHRIRGWSRFCLEWREQIGIEFRGRCRRLAIRLSTIANRSLGLVSHGRQVGSHIRNIAQRAYWSHVQQRTRIRG
jgi:hypothetical protein